MAFNLVPLTLPQAQDTVYNGKVFVKSIDGSIIPLYATNNPASAGKSPNPIDIGTSPVIAGTRYWYPQPASLEFYNSNGKLVHEVRNYEGQGGGDGGASLGKWLPNTTTSTESTGVTDGASLAVMHGAKVNIENAALLNMERGAKIDMTTCGGIEMRDDSSIRMQGGRIDLAWDTKLVAQGGAAGLGSVFGLQGNSIKELPDYPNYFASGSRVFYMPGSLDLTSWQFGECFKNLYQRGDVFYFIPKGEGERILKVRTGFYRDNAPVDVSYSLGCKTAYSFIFIGWADSIPIFKHIQADFEEISEKTNAALDGMNDFMSDELGMMAGKIDAMENNLIANARMITFYSGFEYDTLAYTELLVTDKSNVKTLIGNLSGFFRINTAISGKVKAFKIQGLAITRDVFFRADTMSNIYTLYNGAFMQIDVDGDVYIYSYDTIPAGRVVAVNVSFLRNTL